MKIDFDKGIPMTPEREIAILRDVVTKFAHTVGFCPTVDDVGKDAAYWRGLHEAVLEYSHRRNARINELEKALTEIRELSLQPYNYGTRMGAIAGIALRTPKT